MGCANSQEAVPSYDCGKGVGRFHAIADKYENLGE